MTAGSVSPARLLVGRLHVFPILYPPPTSLCIPSLWVILVHQPRAPCIMHRTWTGDLFHYNLHVSMPFSHIILPSPYSLL